MRALQVLCMGWVSDAGWGERAGAKCQPEGVCVWVHTIFFPKTPHSGPFSRPQASDLAPCAVAAQAGVRCRLGEGR